MEKLKPTFVIQPITFENVKFSNAANVVEQETDCVINFNGKHQIPINKSIMNKRCNFILSMKRFNEANAKEINIQYNTDVTVFTALVDYIKSGKIELTTANINEVTAAAIYFQLDDLLKFCCGVLKQNTDLENVGHIYNLSTDLALTELRKAAVEFEAVNFNKIAKSEVFHGWSMECMLELLSSDQVEVSHEKKVLKFLFDWLNVDPNQRGEHAAALFRQIRFTFLDDKTIDAVGGNSNEKLGQILQLVSSEFSNKITNPRIYHKGVYLCGIDHDDGSCNYCCLRYCPDDGCVTKLKTQRLPDNEDEINNIVVSGNNIYMWESDLWKIKLKVYDAKRDIWIPKSSALVDHDDGFSIVFFEGPLSSFQEKIFAFLTVNVVDGEEVESCWHLCMVYCIKTDTWQRLPPFDGKEIATSTTCGDSIYMTRKDDTDLLQYKPSTGELIDIPCQYDLGRWNYVAIPYKSNILFLPGSPYSPAKLIVLFNTETKGFQHFDITDTYKANGINQRMLSFSLFKDFVFVFADDDGKVFKLDLSFIDESNEPTLIPLPDITGVGRYTILHIASIQ